MINWKQNEKVYWILVTFLVLSLLSGCSRSVSDYETLFVRAEAQSARATNHSKPYVRYYLSPNMALLQATRVSNLLELSGDPILMDLNIKGIVSRFDQSEDDISSDHDTDLLTKTQVYTRKGSYISRDQTAIAYQADVYRLNATYVMIVLNNDRLMISGVIRIANVHFAITEMMMTMMSAIVDEPLVIANYTIKDTLVYENSYESFFEQTVPESGTINEYLEQYQQQ